MLAPIAAVVMWMGIYPESFIAPIRSDIATLDARLAQAKPKGDAALTPPAQETHAQAGVR